MCCAAAAGALSLPSEIAINNVVFNTFGPRPHTTTRVKNSSWSEEQLMECSYFKQVHPVLVLVFECALNVACGEPGEMFLRHYQGYHENLIQFHLIGLKTISFTANVLS